MKKLIFTTAIYFFCFIISSQANVWTQKSNFPGGLRGGPTGFSINNKGYVLTGLNSSNVGKNDLWQWNQTTNTWTQKANLPGPARFSAIAFRIGSKGYVTTGWTSAPSVQLNDLWEYDPTNNSWTQKTNFGGAARYTASAFVVSNYAYVGLGYAPLHNDFWKYDASANSWTQVANLPSSARQSAYGFAIGSYGYVVGGNDGTNLNQLWQYNPATNSWVQKANYPGAGRYGGGGFVINSKAYYGTGGTSTVFYKDFYSYNPNTNQWTAIQSLPGSGRRHSTYFSINGRGYISCGVDSSGGYLDDLWEYGPSTVTITVTGTNVSCHGGNNGSASVVASNGTMPYTYVWSPGGQTTSHINNLTAGIYTVLVTDANGSSGTASISISQPAPLTASLNTILPICKGQSALLSVAASGGTPPYSFLWTPSTGSSTSTSLVSPTSTTTYVVLVTDAKGCSISASTTVTVNGLPSGFISVSNGGIACFPNTVKLSSSSNPNYSWQWKKNGANIPGAVDSVYNASTSGKYRVLVTNANGCTKLSSAVQVTIGQVSAAISPSGSYKICPHDSVNLYAIPSSGYNYQWRKNGVNLVGATQSIYVAKKAGIYKVLITEPLSGCTALSAGTTITVDCKLGASETLTDLYPNPTRDHFTLDFRHDTDRPVSLSIFDISGRLLQLVDQLPHGESFVFGDDLQPGTYFIKIRYPAKETVLRLIKNR